MIPFKTGDLIDLENKAKKERDAFVKKLSLEIEEILLREKLTIQEWGEIVALFNERNGQAITSLTIAELRNKFNQLSK